MADLRSEAAQRAAGLQSRVRAERVNARVQMTAYEEEITAAQEKIRLAEEDLIPLTDHRNRAKLAADKAMALWLALGDAINNPLTSPLGQATHAYVQLRMPQLWQVLLLGDRDHPEWGLAITEMVQLSKISGFRTEDHQMPDKPDRFREMWETIRAEHVESDPVIESAADVIIATHTTITRRMNDAYKPDRSLVENYRVPVLKRPYMDVQRLSQVRGF